MYIFRSAVNFWLSLTGNKPPSENDKGSTPYSEIELLRRAFLRLPDENLGRPSSHLRPTRVHRLANACVSQKSAIAAHWLRNLRRLLLQVHGASWRSVFRFAVT